MEKIQEKSVGHRIRLLVFPLDIDKVRDIIAAMRSLGLEVLGASSVMSRSEAKAYPLQSFHHLPFVTEPHFEQEFLALLKAESVTHVYSPHGVIWTHLKQRQNDKPEQYHFHLCQPSPYEEDWLQVLPSQLWADQVMAEHVVEFLQSSAHVPIKPPLRHGKLASLHRQFVGISGQSDECKLSMLVHIARLLPQGDLVEVGTFQGRSAFAIGWLAQHYHVGNLVCVDPWNNGKLEHQGESASLATNELQQGRDLIDLDKVFRIFITAISSLGNVGYIRDTSEVAIDIYSDASASGCLPANELDALPLAGHIAMLHIDGNHRYDFVKKDVDLWLPRVMVGGWVLLDDYVWAFGDGPKRVGDELLMTGQFDIAFTASDTLFLRKGAV